MGASQAFSIFLLFSEQVSKDSLEFIRNRGFSFSVRSYCFKGCVMKDIMKYSHKYLTFEAIQGIRIFQIVYACVGGESNPGLPGGRRELYHRTTNALQRPPFAISRVLLNKSVQC